MNGFAQKGETKEVNEWDTIKKEVIDQKEYKVEINQVIPRRGQTVYTSNFFFIIKNDSIDSALPYYGRATNIAYGGGEGLNFKAPLKSYEVNSSKEKILTVKLKADSRDDNFEYIISIFPNKRHCIIKCVSK